MISKRKVSGQTKADGQKEGADMQTDKKAGKTSVMDYRSEDRQMEDEL